MTKERKKIKNYRLFTISSILSRDIMNHNKFHVDQK